MDLKSGITTRSGACLPVKLSRKRKVPAPSESTVLNTATGETASAGAAAASAKALQNPLILDEVFKYLPTDELPDLRLTCKIWNSAIIPLMRQNHTELKFSRFLNLKADSIENGYAYAGNNNICLTPMGNLTRPYRKYIDALQEFVNVMKDSNAVPFGSYRIWTILSLSEEPAVDELFQVCGQYMQKLDLTFTFQKDNKLPMSNLGKFIANASVVLRELRITAHNCPTSSMVRDDQLKIGEKVEKAVPTLPSLRNFAAQISDADSKDCSFLREIILAGPNLAKLELRQSRLDDDDNDDPLEHPYILLLDSIKDKAHLENLEEIIIKYITIEEAECLEKLSRNGLKLKKFKAYIDKSAISDGGRCLTKFLQNIGKNLQCLFLELFPFIWGVPEYFQICLPKMVKLEKLTLMICEKACINIQFHSFRENFPNLKSLAYEGGLTPLENVWQHHFLSEPHFGLETLTINGVRTPEQVDNLVATFPSLRSLNVDVAGHSSIRSLWTAWPQLEELYLRFWYGGEELNSFDSYITGIPGNTMNDWRHHNKLVIPCNELIAAKTQPGLIDLIGLKKFSLDLISPPNSPRRIGRIITNNCGYYALAVAKNIKELRIYPDGNGMSHKCRVAIQESLGPHATVLFEKGRSIDDSLSVQFG